VGHIGHVDTPRRDVGGHQDAHAARGEALEGRLAGVLALVAVDGRDGEAVEVEVLGDLVGAMLGACEYDDAAQRFVAQHLPQLGALGGGRGGDDALGHINHSRALRRGFDTHWIAQQPGGEFSDRSRHGGREQRRLALGADGLGDLGHRLDEAHVEHPVGLVEHQPARFVELELAVGNQVLQTARGGDHHVDAARQLVDLGAARHAAQHQSGGQAGAGAEAAQALIDLHRQFAGRRQDQGAAGHGVGTAAHGGKAGQDRQAEGRRLARAGLGDAQDVAALQLRRDGLGLNRRRRIESGCFQALEKVSGQAEFGKCHLSQKILFHGRRAKAARRASSLAGRGINQAAATGLSRGCVRGRPTAEPCLAAHRLGR
jgi:hypothetical protein